MRRAAALRVQRFNESPERADQNIETRSGIIADAQRCHNRVASGL
jgi:hypothetical protein